MDELTGTTGIVALAAGGVALVALVWAIATSLRLRRLRADQRIVLGEDGERDLAEHASDLEAAFRALRDHVEEVHRHIDGRLADVEDRLDGAVAHHAIVRFDAYNEMSGRQSFAIALLDERASGVVVSSIHHRDQARVYAKQVVEGRGESELGPEEQEAVRAALAGDVADAAAG